MSRYKWPGPCPGWLFLEDTSICFRKFAFNSDVQNDFSTYTAFQKKPFQINLDFILSKLLKVGHISLNVAINYMLHFYQNLKLIFFRQYTISIQMYTNFHLWELIKTSKHQADMSFQSLSCYYFCLIL